MLRILALDDSTSDLFFLRRQMRKAAPDCEVHEFNYAEAALQFLKSPGRPALDLILVDINIPRNSGFSFVADFAALYPELKGDAQVYIMSSSLNPEDRARAEADAAIAGYLAKPITLDRVQAVLAEIKR